MNKKKELLQNLLELVVFYYCNDIEFYEMFIKYDANLKGKYTDTDGNTLLHLYCLNVYNFRNSLSYYIIAFP